MIRSFLAIVAMSATLMLPETAGTTETYRCKGPNDETGIDFSVCANWPQDKGGVEIAFSPSGGATALVVHTIESAKTTVRVAAYSFTSKPIAQALLDAQRRGVDVRVVVDKSNATARYTASSFLANQGVPVRVDYRYAIMHDKFVVVDGETVETGSFNFTAAAESHNAENVIVLHAVAVAQRYGQEWERLWAESEEMKPRY
ncbi:MAG TPA: phospholipase D family protein [Bryobacteraceae bacterium]|jgi:phosphatidylserine/phosphatidylglycerophosphate/cardiolipin synthase-like enzyme|nr:phospholipase D family protein [Bryobacteraceae bacterium]